MVVASCDLCERRVSSLYHMWRMIPDVDMPRIKLLHNVPPSKIKTSKDAYIVDYRITLYAADRVIIAILYRAASMSQKHEAEHL